MPQMGKLVACVVSAIIILTFVSYASCTFTFVPTVYRSGKDSPLIENCVDADVKAMGALSGLLATLLALAVPNKPRD